MPPKFAFDMDAALGGKHPSQLSHRSTGAPTSLAERYLSDLYRKKYLPDPSDGYDDDGHPLPLPIVHQEHFDRFWSDIEHLRLLSGSFPPQSDEVGERRIFKTLKCLDGSLILMEKTNQGYAVLPVALFEPRDANVADATLYRDMEIYAQAMRQLPRAVIKFEPDTLMHNTMSRVIPHWLIFQNDGSFATRSKETFEGLQPYYATKIAQLLPGRRLFFTFSGRKITRDGATADGQISIGLIGSDQPDFIAPMEKEFTRAMNHERLSLEWPYLAVNSTLHPPGSIHNRAAQFMGSALLPDEPPSAHDAIEATRQAQRWLNP